MTHGARVDEVPKSRTVMPPNHALERSVRAWQGCAAGAGTFVAPAALSTCVPRPAQRGRLIAWAHSLHYSWSRLFRPPNFVRNQLTAELENQNSVASMSAKKFPPPYFSIVVEPDFIVGVLVIAGITLAVMLIVVMR